MSERELDLQNRQRTRRLNLPRFRAIILTLLSEWLGVREFRLWVHLINATRMARLNHKYLGHSGSTDVITFDYADPAPSAALCGEIFVSVDDAVAQARAFGTSWQSEIVRYAIHGVLHLRGYDDLEPAHRRIMKREENRLLRQASHQFDLRALSRLRTGRREQSRAAGKGSWRHS